jgi:hypothetical protein
MTRVLGCGVIQQLAVRKAQARFPLGTVPDPPPAPPRFSRRLLLSSYRETPQIKRDTQQMKKEEFFVVIQQCTSSEESHQCKKISSNKSRDTVPLVVFRFVRAVACKKLLVVVISSVVVQSLSLILYLTFYIHSVHVRSSSYVYVIDSESES